MGVNSVFGQDTRADYFVVVNGDVCTPCKAFDTLLSYVNPHVLCEVIVYNTRVRG